MRRLDSPRIRMACAISKWLANLIGAMPGAQLCVRRGDVALVSGWHCDISKRLATLTRAVSGSRLCSSMLMVHARACFSAPPGEIGKPSSFGFSGPT